MDIISSNTISKCDNVLSFLPVSSSPKYISKGASEIYKFASYDGVFMSDFCIY